MALTRAAEADRRRRPRNSIKRTRVTEEVPALAHKRRRHAERVVVDPELAQALQRLGLLHIGRQLDLRVGGIDAAEEALAGHDLAVQVLLLVHCVGVAALGGDGAAAGGFLLGGDGAELRGDFVHGSFEDELAAGVGEVGFGDAGLQLGVRLRVGLGNRNVRLGRRCRSAWSDPHRRGIDRGDDPISWPDGLGADRNAVRL